MCCTEHRLVQGSHMCLVKFLIYAAIWIVSGLSFPASSWLEILMSAYHWSSQCRQAESIGIRTTGKYRTLVREQRPGEVERRGRPILHWADVRPGDSHLCNKMAPQVVTMRHFSISAK